ncbi:MAG: hypothetical protein ABGY71_12060 [bacterium]
MGVWVGCLSGADDPAFVGSEAAAPLLAQLFRTKSLAGQPLRPLEACD